jgi:hypothetical protein
MHPFRILDLTTAQPRRAERGYLDIYCYQESFQTNSFSPKRNGGGGHLENPHMKMIRIFFCDGGRQLERHCDPSRGFGD